MRDLVRVAAENGIATVLLNRPETFNAFNLELVRVLSDRLVEVGSDAAVRGVVISGKARPFALVGTSSIYAITPTASTPPFGRWPPTSTGRSSKSGGWKSR